MIIRTKPLKTKLKQTQNPLEDFMLIHKYDSYPVSKETLFVRYIGISHSIELYNESILKIDQHFTSSTSTASYIRLHGLVPIANKNDITRLSESWDYWQGIIDNPITDSYSLQKTPLCAQLENETLEWTKKILSYFQCNIIKKLCC